MTLDIFERYTILYIKFIMETYKTEKEEMRSYRNYSATNGRIVRESDVSSPYKQKYDILSQGLEPVQITFQGIDN